MANSIGNIINSIFILVGIVIIAGIIINCFSKEKEIIATVINKQSYDKQIYGKNQAPYIKKEYVITFKSQNQKRHFAVSELFYDNCAINQKGVLRYKGRRLIDFK